MKILDKFINRIRSDGLFFGSCQILSRIARGIRSRFFSWVLNAPGLDIGGGNHLKGMKYVNFGRDISIFKNIWLEAVTQHNGIKFIPSIIFGDRVIISNNVHISCIKRVKIGNDVLIGSNVHISDHNHGSYSVMMSSSPDEAPAYRELHSSGSVYIEDNVWIGDNVNIVGPATIGAGAVVGSNSVVRGNIPAQTIAAGIPARLIKKYDRVSGIWIRCT